MRFILLVVIGITLSGCGSGGSDQAGPGGGGPGGPGGAGGRAAQAEKPILVELKPVQRGKIEELLERSSPLEAEAQVQVLARTANPAIELLVEEGDLVEKGQVLLRLENDRQQTAFDQAKNDLDKAELDFERQKSLFNQNLISDLEYKNAQFAYDQAKLAAETAARELEYTEVVAPIKGTITQRLVKVGDQVTTGTPIFEIIDLESTVAIINVPEQYLPKLKKDMNARMISPTLGEAEFDGYVKRISPIVDAQTGSVKVVVGVRDVGALRPGMWVDVELVLDSKDDAILIPKPSIIYDNDQMFAFKVYTDPEGVRRAQRQLVTPINSDKEHYEPAEGFEVGDLIVVAGQTGLDDDTPIRELGGSDAETKTPTSVGGANGNSGNSGANANK